VTDALDHLDFLELVEGRKVTATIPLKFTGTAKGVKDGGKLITKMKALKVKAYPKDLREHIDVDLTNLELNGNIRVEDVKAEKYEILNSPRIPVASVVLTRQLKQEESAAAPAAAAPAGGAAAPAAPAAAAAKPVAAKK
jgi:large subunit ribosomal protein L25